ncbi:MAG0480 family ComEC-like protein [Mycoplasma procyoni]|uniref:MAG0480 family ComEC-like protein n=1 Tax=Mycoplasma procyoni TaxID=568784 RepID=UPI00197BA400|nr:ComEC/Rec2 family competence protein [Mycoplasma procyoni]MBN3535022.1 ComEC/Rec2 family competence protein [Mycoplasma procyoni]
MHKIRNILKFYNFDLQLIFWLSTIIFFILAMDTQKISFIIAFSLFFLSSIFLKPNKKFIILIAILFVIFIWIVIQKSSSQLINKKEIATSLNIQKNGNSLYFSHKSLNVLILDKKIDPFSVYDFEFKIEKIETNENLRKNLNYYKSLNIFYYASELKIQKTYHLDFSFKREVFNYFNDSPQNFKKIVSLLLVAQSQDSKDIQKILKDFSIYHLFVVSGFHMGIIKIFIYKLFFFIKRKEQLKFSFFVIFSLSYLFILSFPISALRAFIFIIAIQLNKFVLKQRFSKLQILIFIALAFIIYNPFIIYSYSFILSFLITLNIILVLQLKIKSKVLNLVLISIVANLSSLLVINVSINTTYNLLAIINSIIFSPIISVFYVVSIVFIWNKDFLDFLSFLVIELLEFLKNYQLIANLKIPIIVSFLGIYAFAFFTIVYAQKR